MMTRAISLEKSLVWREADLCLDASSLDGEALPNSYAMLDDRVKRHEEHGNI